MGTARVTDRHTISHAKNLFHGAAQHPGANGAERGVPFNPLVLVDLGAPITLDANGLIAAATGTELPNTETVTYVFATQGGTSPLDGANTTGVLDKPRNVTAVATHASSVVAMTIVVTGKDEYGAPLVESLAIPATGTSQAVAGLKAFKEVDSIAITAAADAEANTLDMGWGDVLGLPYRLGFRADILAIYQDATLENSSTVVAADATDPATATTGDVRGTVVPTTACDGTNVYKVWMKIHDPSSRAGAFGVDQYGG